MPYKEKEIEKLYFSIGEVAAMLDVNASLIRFWEKEFDFIRPSKNRKGNRLFTKDDIEKLRHLYHLVKEKGYTLQGARDAMRDKKQMLSPSGNVADSLEKIKSSLREIMKELD